MGRNTAHEASQALRLLAHPDMLHPTVTGTGERRATATQPGTPLNLGIVDYLTETIGQVADLTHAITPNAAPLPERAEDIYAWCIEQTGNADPAEQAYRDMLIEKQRLEHAVRLGDTDEVCKNPCPRCGYWGLMWEPAGKNARCTNRRCRTPDGLSSSWTLARLAAQTVQRTEVWRRNAT